MRALHPGTMNGLRVESVVSFFQGVRKHCCCNQAIALKTPASGSMSAMAMLRQRCYCTLVGLLSMIVPHLTIASFGLCLQLLL